MNVFRSTVVKSGVIILILLLSVISASCQCSHGNIGNSTSQESIHPSVAAYDIGKEIETLRSKVVAEPKNPFYQEQLVTLLLGIHDLKGAFKHILIAINLSPTTPFYYNRLADMYKITGDNEKALKNYLKAVHLVDNLRKRDMWAACYNLDAAILSKKAGKHKNAETLYEGALVHLNLNYNYMISERDKQENNDTSAKLLSEIQGDLADIRKRLATGRPSVEWIKAQMPYLQISCQSKAQPIIREDIIKTETMIRKGEAGVDLFFNIGNYYLDSGYPDRAVICYKTLAWLNPESDVIRFNLGMSYLLQGRLDEAAIAFTRASELGGEGDEQIAKDAHSAAERYKRLSQKSIKR